MHIICCDTIGGGRSILSYNWLWPVYVVIQLAVAGLYCNKIEFGRSGLIYVVVMKLVIGLCCCDEIGNWFLLLL